MCVCVCTHMHEHMCNGGHEYTCVCEYVYISVHVSSERVSNCDKQVTHRVLFSLLHAPES